MGKKKQVARKLKDVDADFINPFLTAMHETLLQMGGIKSKKAAASLENISTLEGDILVLIKVTGDISGLTILKINEKTLKKLTSLFLFGVPIDTVDEMVKNSFREFTLRVAEKARSQLATRNLHANVSHGVTYGKPLEFGKSLEFITVPYKTEHGMLKVYFNIMKTR